MTELRAQAATSSIADAVEDALDKVADSHREILMLAYWDQLSAKEIGIVLDHSVSAVGVRLHRVRRAFKESFTAVSGDSHGQR